MGVFPVAPYSNSQAKRTLSVPAGADAHYATFDGAGWELSQNNTYATYVPYNGSLPSSTEYEILSPYSNDTEVLLESEFIGILK